MKEPRARIVGFKANGDVICVKPAVYGISLHGVQVVILGCTRTSNDVEGMLKERSAKAISTSDITYTVQVEWVLTSFMSTQRTNNHAKPLTGVGRNSVGKDISMTLLGGRVYTVPWSARSAMPLAPLRICISVGVSGG